MSAEHQRLADDHRGWMRWGPYVAERAWATVREDYSADGENVWDYFPHDHARSRAYRWNEDGLAGVCDADQELCLAWAFWNGRDPILKERLFGLTGDEGNHGEDVKEYWWYLDATPSHSLLKWAYAYPQAAFPYVDLIEENAKRSRLEPEYELGDTGVFADDAYWDIEVTYAKADTDDIAAVARITNRGPERDTLHVLPTLWFRNQWSPEVDAPVPHIGAHPRGLVATGAHGTEMTLTADPGYTPLFCDNETNTRRLLNDGDRLLVRDNDELAWPKDGINDHVLHGAASVNPALTGTKAALWYRCEVDAGETVEITLRFAPEAQPIAEVPALVRLRTTEADAFYDTVIGSAADEQDRRTARQAFAGMIWAKQFYNFDVDRWINGDPGLPAPPVERQSGRNADWWHLHQHDIISMPDPWEYPWYAAWDLAFHAVVLAHIDPQFAKDQLVLMCSEAYMHPNGQLPAYEWSFGDVNPPVHATAALRVYEMDGSRDRAFLTRIFHKLLINFTWWVNRKDAEGNNVFEGGFLGLDNIGPIDRSEGVPDGYVLEQSDGTAWMATFALRMMEMALELSEDDPVYDDLAVKFFDHFAYISAAMHDQGLWDEESGFYYDMLRSADERIPLKIRSMVGLIPLAAVARLPTSRVLTPSAFADHFLWFASQRRRSLSNVLCASYSAIEPSLLLGIADLDRLRRVLTTMLDESEFLSPHGIRSMSRAHLANPFTLTAAGLNATVGYEAGESQTPLFGGNSNWRGPVWFPVNWLLIESLREFEEYTGPEFTVECPTGSGTELSLGEVANVLSDRLISLFRTEASGMRPTDDPTTGRWSGRPLFFEYFDGDTGRGLGASHQTGWTGLVADLIVRR